MVKRLLALLFAVVPLAAAAAPLPPCAGAVVSPAYGEIGTPPQSGVWTGDELRKSQWVPPACLNWSGETKLVAAVASHFQAQDNVFARLAQISAWPTLRYWSDSKQAWRPLASNISATDSNGRRTGALPTLKLAAGEDLTFIETNENTGDTTYRLHVLESTPRRVVVTTENVTPIKVSIMTAFDPGALQTMTWITRDGADSWSTYQLTRVTSGGSSLALSHKGSFLNRLEAVRRFLAGQPTDQLPPIALR